MKKILASTGIMIIAVILIGLFSGVASAQIERQGKLRLLTAVGNGDASVVPDTAEVRIGVETESLTATQAREENASRVQNLVAVLKSLGIPDKDVRTSSYQINPVRRYDEKIQGLPPIVGYNVQNIISVKTEKMDIVPTILDKAVEGGVNRVDSINFSVKNDTAVRQEALRKAVADARANAQQMAKELGVKLDKVYSIQQGGGVSTPMPMMYAKSMSADASSTPVFPGETTINASATVVFIIK